MPYTLGTCRVSDHSALSALLQTSLGADALEGSYLVFYALSSLVGLRGPYATHTIVLQSSRLDHKLQIIFLNILGVGGWLVNFCTLGLIPPKLSTVHPGSSGLDHR